MEKVRGQSKREEGGGSERLEKAGHGGEIPIHPFSSLVFARDAIALVNFKKLTCFGIICLVVRRKRWRGNTTACAGITINRT